jgi:hypothetical protein
MESRVGEAALSIRPGGGSLSEVERTKSAGRADFMKRFFSVAVSVGFDFHLHHVAMFYSVAVSGLLWYLFYRRDQVRHLSLLERAAGSVSIFVFLFAMQALV